MVGPTEPSAINLVIPLGDMLRRCSIWLKTLKDNSFPIHRRVLYPTREELWKDLDFVFEVISDLKTVFQMLQNISIEFKDILASSPI